MITERKYFFILFFVFVLQVGAQKKGNLSNTEKIIKIIEAKDIPLDTLVMNMKFNNQTKKKASEKRTKDSLLTLNKNLSNSTYDLKDYSQAAKFDSLWMKELYKNLSLFDEMYTEVSTLDTDKVYNTSELHTDTLKLRLQRLNEKTPFNLDYNPTLENVIRSFLIRKRGLIERMLTVSQFYFPLFEQQLDSYNIPLEMKYLAIVESALNPRARSRVGATGLWQFMYHTGKMYKLDVTSYIDERRDPIKSTEAACKYLSKLYSIFNDWDLALAAYNSGPGNVNKAIRRSGGHKNYWNIRRNLPRETAGYVPAFIATMYLFEYAEEHGIKGKKSDRPYFETDTVHVKSLITFDQISKLVGISTDELKILNPSYKLNVIPFIKGKNYTLRLPRAIMGKFVTNETAIYAHVAEELKSKESPLPALVKTASQNRVRYKVRSGDYLGKIASRYGVRVSQIKRWNGLRGNNIRIGQRLTIYPRGGVVSTAALNKKSGSRASIPTNKMHTVQRGETLWTISRKYSGITVDNLRKWNSIRGSNIKMGTELKLCDC